MGFQRACRSGETADSMVFRTPSLGRTHRSGCSTEHSLGSSVPAPSSRLQERRHEPGDSAEDGPEEALGHRDLRHLERAYRAEETTFAPILMSLPCRVVSDHGLTPGGRATRRRTDVRKWPVPEL